MHALPKLMATLPLAIYMNYSVAESNTYNFNIPAQPLSSALNAVSKQTGLQPFYADEAVAGKQSPALKGTYSKQQAVEILLADSDLNHTFTGNNSVAVKAKPIQAKTADGTTTSELKEMTVIGESDDDFNKNYTALNSTSPTRTDTPIMQTPQSIQVIKRALIDDQQSVTVSESLRNVSGVVSNNAVFTPSVDYTRIRGFRAEQLLDGFSQYYNPGDRESTINIGRIDVLKGSNAILYSGGAGAPVGGVVNIASKQANPKQSGEVGVRIGTNNYYQPFFDVNQPLLKDNILFRLTGEYTNAGSYLDVVKTERYNINPILTFTNNDTTTLRLQGKVSRWNQPEYQGLPATGTITGNFSTPRKTFVGPNDMPDSRSEFNGVWGSLDHKFNDMWSMNLKARYANSQFDEKVQSLAGADGFTADRPAFRPSTWFLANAELFQQQEERSFLGNATAKFDMGRTKNTVLFGADHSDYQDQGFMDVDMMNTGFINLNKQPLVSTLAYKQAGEGKINQFVNNTTYGGYVQLQSTIYDRFHLLTSVRAGHVTTDFQNTSTKASSKASKTKILPRVGAVFDVTNEFSLFINYSEGMRGQPFVNFSGTPQPEESTSLEGGIKFNIAEQVTGQIAGYQIDRTNVAIRDNSDRFFRSVAKGQQRSRGIEADVTWQATEGLSILANYAHTDARFTDDLAGVPKNNRLLLVPENTGRLWVNYSFQQPLLRGLSVGGGLYAQSAAYLSNNNTFKAEGYHNFDASVAYEKQNFKVSATVKNLTNERYYQAFGYFDGRVIPSEGTSAYFTASFKY
ncbi:MAG: TonB-dependent receptor [Methylococcales bacterium]|nr:TonB-dependent receptor [Methylococcales bacterium]